MIEGTVEEKETDAERAQRLSFYAALDLVKRIQWVSNRGSAAVDTDDGEGSARPATRMWCRLTSLGLCASECQ